MLLDKKKVSRFPKLSPKLIKKIHEEVKPRVVLPNSNEYLITDIIKLNPEKHTDMQILGMLKGMNFLTIELKAKNNS